MRTAPIVIVGAGPAGVAAAVQCHRLGATPLLLDRTGKAGGLIQNAFCIENYPGLEEPISGPLFAERLRSDLTRHGIMVVSETVDRVVRAGHGFKLSSGSAEFLARVVIVAVGTRPKPLGLDGENELLGTRVFYEVHELFKRYPRPNEVSVIGAGEAACDYALSLAQRGTRVSLVVRGDRLNVRGQLADRVFSEPQISILFGRCCEGFTKAPAMQVNLRVKAHAPTVNLDADAVLIAIGRVSLAPDLLGPLKAAVGPGKPGIPGLTIVGDARTSSLGQVGIAVGDGLQAAEAAVNHLKRA